MEIGCLPFYETGYFSSLIQDYVTAKKELDPFYGETPDLKGLNTQRALKANTFSTDQRAVLQSVLRAQYQGFEVKKAVNTQIEALGLPSTTTVVTGHQLNLFSGPLYFLYKIIAVVNLAKSLNKDKKLGKVVPIYWMATEDHDFEEINHFNVNGIKLQWNPPFKTSGAVGHYKTDGLQGVLTHLETLLGRSKNAKYLANLFRNAYLKQPNLAKATRYFAHELFGDLGLLIIDADDAALKKMLIPHIKKDLFKQTAYKEITQTNTKLLAVNEAYHIQVTPRPINYFYLAPGIRERIIANETGFEVLNTNLKFSKAEMETLIEKCPEKFSPNVVARPLYQEVILPNIAYLGGGGELAYWLELKEYFKAHNVLFPVLILRNSAVLLSNKQYKKWTKMGLSISDLFLKRDPLINKKIRAISNIDLDLSPMRKVLHNQFLALQDLAQQTDASFLGAVQAQEAKQLKGIDALEKRLLLAQKRKLSGQVARLSQLHEALFPQGSLQERSTNFAAFYTAFGPSLIHELVVALNPLDNGFSVMAL